MRKILALLISVVTVGMLFTSCSGNSKFDTTKEISVISREDGSGTRGAFIELMGIEEKDAAGNKKDKTTKEALIANKTDVMMTTVAGDPLAIGYVSLGSLKDNETVKAMKIDGTQATVESIKNGSYKISRPFNIATKGEVQGIAKDFIDYILSSDGQTVVAYSYIAINDDNSEGYKGTKPAGKIVVAGSSSVTPLMEKLKEAYLKINTNAEIEIQMSDSSSGMNAVNDGTCDIGMASRELKDSEKETLTSIKIALDGIVMIVNNKNTVETLTSEQVKNIYTGSATKWSEVIG